MTTVEMLTELVADEGRPAAERERAAEVLKFYAESVKYATEHPRPGMTIETEVTVAKMLGELNARKMWFDPDDCLLQAKTGPDGSTYQTVVSKKYHGPQAHSVETPASVSVKVKSAPQPELAFSPVMDAIPVLEAVRAGESKRE